MSDYILKSNEVLNGGYTVEIGGFTLRSIGKYTPSWVTVYDEENSFTDYQGNRKKIIKGIQFTLDISTGRLTPFEFSLLRKELEAAEIDVVCPDFEGKCYCDNIPGELNQANFHGTYYKVNITLTACKLTSTDGGGL